MTSHATAFHAGRHAGVLVPLFSIPSTGSWGIGEIPDIAALAPWLRAAGHDILQLLPVNEMAGGQSSPYSALSAMAIDPIFIGLRQLEDWTALGGEQALDKALRGDLAAARQSPRIDYARVRRIKWAMLRACFDRFLAAEWHAGTPRAGGLRAFIEGEGWWLDDYGLFRALHAAHEGRAWTGWEAGLRDRDPRALDRARAELSREVLFYQYLQWIADGQWAAARAQAHGIGLFGDFPFMVDADSVDVWARQGDFRVDASVGTPPDAFSEDGQDWGLPVYRWDVLAGNDYAWLRQRARRTAALYDGYRVDHLVGFYRTYVRPCDGSAPFFVPESEDEQRELGERLLGIFRSAGPEIIAEDLGTVPDFVRESLARLEVPGYKVLRWEREWHAPGQPFRDPEAYPAVSVATSGTHDTEPLAVWWAQAPADERESLAAIPLLRDRLPGLAREPFSPRVRDALLEVLFASGSNLLLLPVGDLFGWRDQVNVPGTVTGENWTWRLPWPSDRLEAEPEARARAAALRALSERYHRGRGLHVNP